MLPENQRVLDDFGKQLMLAVRDNACESLQRVISGKMNDAMSRKLFDEYWSLGPAAAEVLHRFLVTSVDFCLAQMLNFIDSNEIKILFTSQSGEDFNIQQISDGLVGELYTEDGWITRFSKFKDRVDPLQ